MSEYLNGGLEMIEDTVQQLSAKSQHDESRDEETVLDIRPEQSVQARNKLVNLYLTLYPLKYSSIFFYKTRILIIILLQL